MFLEVPAALERTRSMSGVPAACLEGICRCFGGVSFVRFGGSLQRVSGTFSSCFRDGRSMFPMRPTVRFRGGGVKVLRLVSRERHIRIQAWLPLAFGVACDSLLSSWLFESLG